MGKIARSAATAYDYALEPVVDGGTFLGRKVKDGVFFIGRKAKNVATTLKTEHASVEAQRQVKRDAKAAQAEALEEVMEAAAAKAATTKAKKSAQPTTA